METDRKRPGKKQVAGPAAKRSGRDARSAAIAKPRLGFEGCPAAHAVPGRGTEPAAAFGAELGAGFGARTVLRTTCTVRRSQCGGRHFRRTAHGVRRTLATHRRQRLGRVLGFQLIVVDVGEFPRRAIELDLLERAERHDLWRHVIVGVFALVVGRRGGAQRLDRGLEDRQQDEIHRARRQQDAQQELDHVLNQRSLSSSRCKRSSSSGDASAGVVARDASAITGAGASAVQRRSTFTSTAAAIRITMLGTKYPARLKPRRGGAISAASPYCPTNASMICCAVLPCCASCMTSLCSAGL